MTEAELNALSKQVLNAAFDVHKVLGPGLLEAAYSSCFAYELSRPNLHFEREVPVPLVYAGKKLADVGYRMDYLVERHLIVELKAVDAIAPVHEAQLVSYLRLSGHRLGLLINFNVALLRDGIRRRVNQF